MSSKIIIIFFTFLLGSFFPLKNISAQIQGSVQQGALDNFNTISGEAGFEKVYDENTKFYQEGQQDFILYQISVIIGLSMMALGLIFLGLTIYGGLLWMTAQGKEDQIDRAIKMIKHGAIGALIIGSAYIISYFVSQQVLRITQNPTAQTEEVEPLSPWEFIFWGVLEGAEFLKDETEERI